MITHDPTQPERFIVARAPLAQFASGVPIITQFQVFAPLAAATLQVVGVGFEGDRSLTGDSIAVNGSTVLANAFVGSIPGTRSPADVGTLGIDVAMATAAGLTGNSVSVTFATTNDRVTLGVVVVVTSLDV